MEDPGVFSCAKEQLEFYHMVHSCCRFLDLGTSVKVWQDICLSASVWLPGYLPAF